MDGIESNIYKLRLILKKRDKYEFSLIFTFMFISKSELLKLVNIQLWFTVLNFNQII